MEQPPLFGERSSSSAEVWSGRGARYGGEAAGALDEVAVARGASPWTPPRERGAPPAPHAQCHHSHASGYDLSYMDPADAGGAGVGGALAAPREGARNEKKEFFKLP